jgi:peptide/nickel transport system permease protein
MRGYVVERLGQGVLVLIIASMVIFTLVRFTGNPVALLLPADAPQSEVERVTRELGLDRPLHEQYLVFVAAVSRGDFGTSIRTKLPVSTLIGERLPNSMQLGGLTLVSALLIGLPIGVLSAVKRGTFVDVAARMLALFGQSVPSFWLGIVFIAVFAGSLKLLPAARMSGPESFILPVATLTLSGFLLSGTVRFIRSGMLEVLNTEYIKLARAKGLAERTVIWKHALANASLALVTFLGFYLTLLLGGASLVVETVFAWPGIGTLLNQALLARDFPVVQAIVVLYVAGFVVIDLLVDLLYAFLDPRIRYR